MFFGQLKIGDVMPDAHQTANPSLTVPERQFGRQHRVLPAVRKTAIAGTVNDWLSGKYFHLLGAELGSQSRREKVRVGQPKKLGGIIFA